MHTSATSSIAERRVPEMRSALAAFERSGLSQRAFCCNAGLALSTFTYWRRRLRQVKPVSSKGFVEIEVVSEQPNAGAVTLELPGGVRAIVTSSASEDLICRLLRAAQSC